MMKKRLRAYYLVTKPGIVQGNALHALAGALFASTPSIAWKQLIGVLVGTSLVIASACVANNYMDRGIDARMKRTKSRPSVTGLISLRSAMVYATVLFLLGIVTLFVLTNLIVIAIGIIAYILYVFVYGWAKRNTIHSTLIGAIPGALPAMAGYVAITGELSMGAWLVFLIIFAWQMPHFYAISVFRKQDYESAGLPVLGVVKPIATVKHHTLFYLLLYVIVIAMMITTQTVGAPAGLLLLAGALYWVATYYKKAPSAERWARSLFGASLVLSIILVIASALNIFTSGT